jgi:hypothetical protein
MPAKHNTATSKYINDLKHLQADIVVVAKALEIDWDRAYKLVLLSWVRAQPAQELPPKTLG